MMPPIVRAVVLVISSAVGAVRLAVAESHRSFEALLYRQWF